MYKLEDGVRKVKWIELFFDLVFVAAAHQFATLLKYSETYWHALGYMLLFCPILWIWLGHTMYSNRFEDHSIFYHVVTFLKMGGVLGLVVMSTNVIEFASYFAVTYAFVRLLLLVLYIRAITKHPDKQPLLFSTMMGFGIAAVIWFVSAFTTYAPILWLIAFLIDAISPILAHDKLAALSIHATHLPERLGLLTVIMLGELIISMTVSVFDLELSAQIVVALIVGLIMIAAISLVYFQFVERGIVGFLKGSGQLYMYSHLPMFVGLVALAAGLKGILQEAQVELLIITGLVLFIMSFKAIKIVRDKRLMTRQVIAVLIFIPSLFIYRFLTDSVILNTVFIAIIFVIYLLISEFILPLLYKRSPSSE